MSAWRSQIQNTNFTLSKLNWMTNLSVVLLSSLSWQRCLPAELWPGSSRSSLRFDEGWSRCPMPDWQGRSLRPLPPCWTFHSRNKQTSSPQAHGSHRSTEHKMTAVQHYYTEYVSMLGSSEMIVMLYITSSCVEPSFEYGEHNVIWTMCTFVLLIVR